MSRFPTAQSRRDLNPRFLAVAQRLYGEAFGLAAEDELEESMADWSELSEAERSFALGHLQYLNLLAHAGTQKLLSQACELLEELVEYAEERSLSAELDEAETIEVPPRALVPGLGTEPVVEPEEFDPDDVELIEEDDEYQGGAA